MLAEQGEDLDALHLRVRVNYVLDLQRLPILGVKRVVLDHRRVEVQHQR